MLDWTDRHCRYFHRLLSHHTRLYTEMVTTGALTHGSVQRHLRFNAQEHPVALQLGGSDPEELAQAAKLGQQWGYDEINLNCGCPSDRVRRGAFGACLMNEPHTVAQGVKAMRDAVSIPVTVKHRIGIDRVESYAFVRDFVGTVSQAGCEVFIVHARNAWLDGLSPKENREIPPLRYELAYQLKRDFPELTIAVNGGIRSASDIATHLQHADGVMLGREAYYNPWLLSTWDADFFNEPHPQPSRETVEEAMIAYMERAHAEDGCPWYAIARHMLGLYHGQRGGRLWRQVWSDHRLKPLPPRQVWQQARQALAKGAARDGVSGVLSASHSKRASQRHPQGARCAGVEVVVAKLFRRFAPIAFVAQVVDGQRPFVCGLAVPGFVVQRPVQRGPRRAGSGCRLPAPGAGPRGSGAGWCAGRALAPSGIGPVRAA